ncbi:hypothetical protein M0802_009425 [Mischocyttarus mexicanus]|nr:hypothetical protein M0802_009425 [Mischocyttarus mexicanus]
MAKKGLWDFGVPQRVSGCKCVKYSSADRPLGGTFMTPYFPRRYPPSIDCLLYTFIGQPNEIVKLNFHHFNIHRVRSDYIKELVVGSPGLDSNERHGRQTLGTLESVPSFFLALSDVNSL